MLVIPLTFDSESSNLNFEVFRLTFANFTRLTAVKPTCDTKIGLLSTNVLVEIEWPGTRLRIGKKEEKIGVGEWRETGSSLVAPTQATARLGFCPFPPLWSRSFCVMGGGRGGGGGRHLGFKRATS